AVWRLRLARDTTFALVATASAQSWVPGTSTGRRIACVVYREGWPYRSIVTARWSDRRPSSRTRDSRMSAMSASSELAKYRRCENVAHRYMPGKGVFVDSQADPKKGRDSLPALQTLAPTAPPAPA